MKPIVFVLALLIAACKPEAPEAPQAGKRIVIPESRGADGKLTRSAVTWASDGTAENIQWIHDNCAGVDPIPVECLPYLVGNGSPSPTTSPNATSTPTPTPVPTATATSTPRPSASPTGTATATPTATPVAMCTVPNFIGTNLNQAKATWRNAGFRTAIVRNGQGQKIIAQSLAAGSQADCNSGAIIVTTGK